MGERARTKNVSWGSKEDYMSYSNVKLMNEYYSPEKQTRLYPHFKKKDCIRRTSSGKRDQRQIDVDCSCSLHTFSNDGSLCISVMTTYESNFIYLYISFLDSKY